MQQQQAAYPSAPALRRWLRAEQSLTARLRRHGPVQVQVLRQGHLPLRRAEQQDLQARSGYVREVILHLQGRPAVWARSATTAHAAAAPMSRRSMNSQFTVVFCWLYLSHKVSASVM